MRGSHADYRRAHPARAALIVEVAEPSLADRVVEVYRNPGPDLTASFGWRYSAVERVHPPAALTLLELPQAAVHVAALLP